jgi:hypothetical protein
MVRREKMAMEDWSFLFLFFSFLFLGIKILASFNPKIAKLVEFKIEKNPIFSQFLYQKMANFHQKKETLDGRLQN